MTDKERILINIIQLIGWIMLILTAIITSPIWIPLWCLGRLAQWMDLNLL
jgi:hypothetical protein